MQDDRQTGQTGQTVRQSNSRQSTVDGVQHLTPAPLGLMPESATILDGARASLLRRLVGQVWSKRTYGHGAIRRRRFFKGRIARLFAKTPSARHRAVGGQGGAERKRSSCVSRRRGLDLHVQQLCHTRLTLIEQAPDCRVERSSFRPPKTKDSPTCPAHAPKPVLPVTSCCLSRAVGRNASSKRKVSRGSQMSHTKTPGTPIARSGTCPSEHSRLLGVTVPKCPGSRIVGR